jgi:drug/metabolite transporter (DMT)-like permease
MSSAGHIRSARPAHPFAARSEAVIGPLVLWMVGLLVSACAMAVSVRMLADAFSVFEIISIRSAGGLAILLPLLLVRPALRAALVPSQMGLHVARNSLHFVTNAIWTVCVTLLPLATVFALDFTAPAWVALLAVLFLGERLTPSRIGSVVLGFIGTLIILRPGFDSFQPAALLMLLTAFGLAVTGIITKKLTATVSIFAILFWMNAMQLPMALIGSDSFFLLKMTSDHVVPTIVFAITGLSSHYCLANAFRVADATVVIPLDFLRVPAIAVIGWALYGEHIDVFVVVGAAVVITGILWNLHAESRRRALQYAPPAE